jgi:alpha-tubulin suppressor-like RCC1 family protein
MALVRTKQIKPGTDGQVIKTVSGTPLFANHSLTKSDKGLAPGATSGDNNDTTLTISSTPSGDGHVEVKVNGAQQVLGDGVRTKDCYFASDHLLDNVVAGTGSSLATKANELCWSWGDGIEGQLGYNSTVERSSPVSVVGAHSFPVISAGGTHSLGLKSDGSAWDWGDGASGQLGQGTTTASRSSPVSVVGAHSFGAIAGGVGYSFGLKSNDGSAWTWGLNTLGQLGQGTDVANRSSPTSVVGAHSFSRIDCGANHALALKSDGTAWAWGQGSNGVLGQGTDIANRSSPASVVGAHSFSRVSGGSLSAALKADGSAWAWGGDGGALGQGTTVANRSSPVSVVGGHSFVEISVGSFVAALKADGSVWAWGSGGDGQLGQGTDVANRSSPVSVIGAHSFIKISSGQKHVLALKNGEAWAWGLNSLGELGDNTTTYRSSPVSVVGGPATRSISDIQAGDVLVWNGAIAGFDLDAGDVVDLDYID